tara:strand:- start:1041 stop:2000 length:960 start_codon:yes stop_codon:yes gene_type:complete
MKPKEILVFGATGHLGKNLLRKLTRNNYKVTAVTRNIHRKGYMLKKSGNAGWIDIVELESFNYERLKEIFKNKDICINLVGILNEKNKSSFYNMHSLLPKALAKISKENNLEQFIHISALGIEDALESKYASSKLDGEIEVKKIFKNHTILKPSIIFSRDDNFTTLLLSMLKLLPVFPLYYEGKTIFYPIHVTDMCEIIEKVILNEIKNKTIECIGPEKITFKEIIQRLLRSLEIKRILIPTPLVVAKLFAKFFEITMKNPLLTRDQLILLSKKNAPSGKYKTNIDLKLNSDLKYFNKEISKYSYMWKTGGEFSKNEVN